MRHRSEDPHTTSAVFGEASAPKGLVEDSQHMTFRHRADCIEDVENEALSVAHVGMEDPEPRVEAKGSHGQSGFRFERVG